MIIDTHSHLNFAAFKKDADNVIKKTLAQNIWTINVGTKYETSRNAIELAEQYQQGVYAAIGLHPMYAAAEFIKLKTDLNEGNFLIREQTFEKEKYRKLAKSKKVVAVGEIGLDYYYKPKTTAKFAQFKEKQKQVFVEQFELAQKLNLPVILHCRMAHQDLIQILKSYILNHKSKIHGVVHCFTGTVAEMKEYINLGLYIGFNGIIFKLNLNEVVKNCQLKNMLLETDCPYLTPPQESGKRNEPIFIKHTIQKIADLKGVSFQEICQKTTENAKIAFDLH